MFIEVMNANISWHCASFLLFFTSYIYQLFLPSQTTFLPQCHTNELQTCHIRFLSSPVWLGGQHRSFPRYYHQILGGIAHLSTISYCWSWEPGDWLVLACRGFKLPKNVSFTQSDNNGRDILNLGEFKTSTSHDQPISWLSTPTVRNSGKVSQND